jgi:hypothetical protein
MGKSVQNLLWHRSTRCEASNCAEVARTPRGVLLRSSLRPRDVLELSRDQWTGFLESLCGDDYRDRA